MSVAKLNELYNMTTVRQPEATRVARAGGMQNETSHETDCCRAVLRLFVAV